MESDIYDIYKELGSSDERCYVNAKTNNAEMYNMLQGIPTFTA